MTGRVERRCRQPARQVTERAALRATWVAAAVGLGVLLLLAEAARTGGDDPDPAWQRPGILDLGPLPLPAPDVIEGFPTPGQHAVVFFAPEATAGQLCRSLAEREAMLERAQLAMVVPGGGTVTCPEIRVVEDPKSRITKAYGLRRPRDGGLPTGYAIVDSSGRIRYRTLDPSVAAELAEVATMLADTP